MGTRSEVVEGCSCKVKQFFFLQAAGIRRKTFFVSSWLDCYLSQKKNGTEYFGIFCVPISNFVADTSKHPSPCIMFSKESWIQECFKRTGRYSKTMSISIWMSYC